jgi:type III pantothenate kinase
LILLVDAGNSRIKWRLQARGKALAAGALPTSAWADLPGAWHGCQARAACVCSVAGEKVDAALRQGLAQVLAGAGGQAGAVHWLVAQARAHGVENLYAPAAALGPDRYAALVAARRRQKIGWVVVNVGTAMTADMLAADGRYLGGIILPGPDLMRRALAQGTAGVRLEGAAEAVDPPRNTRAAVSRGIAWALWGGVEGMKRHLELAQGRPARVMLSGGGRNLLAPMLGDGVTVVDELVLEGLAWIARDLGYDA